MTIRPAEESDIPLAVQWHRERGQSFSPCLLPKIGVVAEDEQGACGAVWLYLDNSVGVGFPEHLVMRRGLSLKRAVETGQNMLRGIESAAKALGYGLLVANVLPACGRFLPAIGWQEADDRRKQTMMKLI